MQANEANDEQVFQLIRERMDEGGITLSEVVDYDINLALLVKRGIAGEPVKISDSRLYDFVDFLGLISRRGSGQIPSREQLITLLGFGELPLARRNRLVDWGCDAQDVPTQ